MKASNTMSPYPTRDERWFVSDLVVVVFVAVAWLMGLSLGLVVGGWVHIRPATMHLLDQDGQLLIEFAEEPTPEQVERFRTVFRQYEARALSSALQPEPSPLDVDPLLRPRSGG